MSSSEINIVQKGGAFFLSCKPLLSPDCKLLVCGCGPHIKVISVASGQCVHTLVGHTELVTGLLIPENNQYQLLSCSADHQLCVWSYQEGVQLATYQVNNPLHTLTQMGQTIYALRPTPLHNYDIVKFDCPSWTQKAISPEVILPQVVTHPVLFSVGSETNKLLAAAFEDELVVYSAKKGKSIEHKFPSAAYNKSPYLTCLAVHPSEKCVASGVNDGRIVLWYNPMSPNVTRTILHWHSLPVLSLCFSTEGSYILSGGHECVLVKWQLQSLSKDFFPRLGAPITRITCAHDGSLFATGHEDNSILLITSSLIIKQHIQGLTMAYQNLLHPTNAKKQRPLVPVGLLQDPRTNTLVTNGRPGHLQFYDVRKDEQLYNLDVVGQNYISPEHLSNPLTMTDIDHASLSDEGNWLITLERRDDGQTSVEMRLKFWLYDDEKQSYELNTCVESPHSAAVNCLQCRPLVNDDQLPLVVTTGLDKCFKLWALEEKKDEDEIRGQWTCDSVSYYKKRNAGRAAFSADGATLAVCFEKTITLWEPETNALVDFWALLEVVNNVMFGREKFKKHILATTPTYLYCIDDDAKEVKWKFPVEISCWCHCPTTEYFTVCTKDKKALVFSPASAEPLFQVHVSQHDLLASIFLTRPNAVDGLSKDFPWLVKSQLFIFNSQQEMLTLDVPGFASPDWSTDSDPVNLIQNIPQTALNILISSNQKRNKEEKSNSKDIDDDILAGRAEFMKQFLLLPSHAVPMLYNCDQFFDTLLPKSYLDKVQADSEEDDEDEMEAEQDSAAESDS